MAWRLLDFDRCLLSTMGNHPRKQHINREGLVQELHELGASITNNNEVALLNDITHILKKGDVTAKLADGTFEFVEVKSSNTKSSRVVRQMKDLEETISFLNDGKKEDEKGRMQISTLPVTPENYFRGFERLLDRAEKEGALVDRIGNHLILNVIDFSAASRDIDLESTFNKRDELVKKWVDAGDMVLDFLSVDRYTSVMNYAPFSIFPIQHRHRVALMTGSTLVSVALNVSEVFRYLDGRGWKVVKGPAEFAKEAEGNKSKDIPLAAIKNGPLTIHLAAPMVGRLANEFQSIRSLADTLDGFLAGGRGPAVSVFTNLSGEAGQWD